MPQESGQQSHGQDCNFLVESSGFFSMYLEFLLPDESIGEEVLACSQSTHAAW